MYFVFYSSTSDRDRPSQIKKIIAAGSGVLTFVDRGGVVCTFFSKRLVKENYSTPPFSLPLRCSGATSATSRAYLATAPPRFGTMMLSLLHQSLRWHRSTASAASVCGRPRLSTTRMRRAMRKQCGALYAPFKFGLFFVSSHVYGAHNFHSRINTRAPTRRYIGNRESIANLNGFLTRKKLNT